MVKAEILADSLNPYTDDRLTSYLLTYPRFIHSELMTHRVLSRNAASSRAIPVEKMIRMIRENPAMPVVWPKNGKGMQATEYLDIAVTQEAEKIWLAGLEEAIHTAERLLLIGVHKQVANRVLEPWAHMTTLVSGTEWGNFFRLRAHPAAQPEFQALAYEMLRLYRDSEPRVIEADQWHLPYRPQLVELEEYAAITPSRSVLHVDHILLKVAVARCARTSYANFDGTFSIDEDIAVHDRLLKAGHMSPFEHIAQPLTTIRPTVGNFCGWRQYRSIIEPLVNHVPLTKHEMNQLLGG